MTKTKTVMKDVGVWSFGFAGSNIIGIMTLKTRTDAEGRFRPGGTAQGPWKQVADRAQ